MAGQNVWVSSTPPMKRCREIISRATLISAGPRNKGPATRVPRSRVTTRPTKPESGVWRILFTSPCYPPTSQTWLESKGRCLEKAGGRRGLVGLGETQARFSCKVMGHTWNQKWWLDGRFFFLPDLQDVS